MSKSLEGLAFNPGPECDRPDCCDLSCVWPGERNPIRWQGDDA
jgi:hypothetical protein